MNFEEFARESGKALTDATAPLRPPSITEISSRRRRSTLTAGAVGVAAVLVGAVAVAGVINRDGPAVPPATSFSTATTMSAEPAPDPLVVDLLDGSRLEAISGLDLELSGYFFFLDRPELGGVTNVYVTPVEDPAEAAAAERAELEADFGSGVQVWRGRGEGDPLFMSVDLDGWVVFLHVGWDTPPDSADLLALAGELRGDVTDQGVILPNRDIETFTTYLESPDSENQIHLGIGECPRELVPGSEVVEDSVRGEVIRGSNYASWCDTANDLEVRVHGDAGFVFHRLSGLTLRRTYPESQPTTTTAPPSTTLAPTEPTTTLPPSSAAVTPIEPGPLDGRFGHSVVWTGSEMIVWGGHTESITEALSDGAAYDPGTDQWRMIADPPLDGMTWHFATWSGSEMLVVGTAGAAAYEPTSDSWRLLPTSPIPIHRVAADISDLTEYAWSGEHIYVWNPISDELARLNESASEWEAMESPGLNVYPAKILAEDDRVLVFGTRWPSGIAEPSTYELFGSALTDAGWVELPAIDFVTDGYANVADPGTASFVGENVLVWGDPSPEPGNARLLHPDGTWSAAPPPPIDENILHPRPIGLDNGRVLALSEGGDAAIWSPIQNDWASVGSLPGILGAREGIWTGDELIAWSGGESWRWSPTLPTPP